MSDQNSIRVRLEVHGRVQGVGFRPTVYRLAAALRLGGVVGNDAQGAFIEIEGPPAAVEDFVRRLPLELPARAEIAGLDRSSIPAVGASEFRIDLSRAAGEQEAEISPDIATCADCLREMRDPADRRYRYPFINCTNCGPRYSIVQGVPYDRARTTMAKFAMCPDCQREYDDPANRRFHAQPNACPVCGPKLWLSNGAGTELDGDPIEPAAAHLRAGGIVAVKGLGGFHLACDASSDAAVRRLRERKGREAKPFALMVPSAATAAELVELDNAAKDLLQSWRAPIVLARRRPTATVSAAVAPDSPSLGVMLPYTPLHHLLFAAGLGPLVMTSANPTAEPLCAANEEALERLRGIADAFLLHDRDIERRVDDSVIAVPPACRRQRDATAAAEPAPQIVPVRRSRGYVPAPIRLPRAAAQPILAVGGDLKSVVCLVKGNAAVLSEHLGELANPAAYRNFVRAIDCFKEILKIEPEVVVCDLHPGYHSVRYAQSLGLPVIALQHHYAHAVAALAEHNLDGPVLALCADGTGYGTDGTIWGCELLVADPLGFRRVGHLRQFPLSGGDAAARDTWRPATALLQDTFGEEWADSACFGAEVDAAAVALLTRRLRAGTNVTPTSSLGRLFDAAACILGLRSRNRFEADAAMTLEATAAECRNTVEPLTLPFAAGQFDYRPLVRDLVRRKQNGEGVDSLALAFHLALADGFAQAIEQLAGAEQLDRVVLSGGCFLNRLLTDALRERLAGSGLQTYSHTLLPPGDGGLALGQAWVAARRPAGQ